MEQLKPAAAGMFEEIYSSLLRHHDPTIPKEKWRNLFSPAWGETPDAKVGYVLMEDSQYVGFLGLIVAERNIGGSIERFANVTSWIAKSGAGRGALLVFPLRDLKTHTVTNLTSTPAAYSVFRRIGFDVLETHYRIIPTMQPRSGPRWSVTEDDDEIAGLLSNADLGIYRDHAPYVRQIVASQESRYCHMVFSPVQRRGVRVVKVHHFGGPAAPSAAIPDIGRYLIRHGILAFDCDDRLIDRLGNGWSVKRKLVVPRLYRSESLEPDQISELYSELVLLGNA